MKRYSLVVESGLNHTLLKSSPCLPQKFPERTHVADRRVHPDVKYLSGASGISKPK